MARLREGVSQLTIYVPEEVYEKLRTKAFFERTSINKLVLAAIDESLRKSPAPKLPKPRKPKR